MKLLLGPLTLDGVADGAEEQGAISLALDEIVLGTRLHGLEGNHIVVEAAQHDDRQAGAFAHPLEGLQPFRVGQREVEQDDVEGGPAQA